MKKILDTLYQGKTLNRIQINTLLSNILQKKMSPIQIASALISMKIRGETFEEILGAATMLRTHSKPFSRPNTVFADITGTGGDGKNTINISTISAIVASTCGAKIIKHGNYNISSIAGSMDLLETKKIHQNSSLEAYNNQALKNFDELGICFLCALHYHTILQDIMSIRKELGTPTLFNIIGPLVNPSQPSLALIGVYKKELLFPITQALKSLNYHHAIIVHCVGIDEVGLHGPTNVFELYNNRISEYILTPSDFGLNHYPIEDLYCHSKNDAFNHMISLLKGKGKLSHTAVIAANVALLLKLFGCNNLQDNVLKILDNIHQGIPYQKLLSLSNVFVRQNT